MDALNRIAAALERLSPPPPPAADPAAHPAYLWSGGVLARAAGLDAPPLDRLVGVDAAKAALLGNLRRLGRGLPAHDVLLWGARGTGKSALVKASVAALQAEGLDLALVEVADAGQLPALFRVIGATRRAWAVFVDDLGIDRPADARALRSVLEGGAEPRPANARLLVTANRRHLQPRDMGAQAAAVNARDEGDDQLALADRFGLSLGFHAMDQDAYLAAVRSHAGAAGLSFDPADAVGWATRRGSRSGRVAWQYVVELSGREGRVLDGPPG